MVSRISSQKANPTHPVETLATRYVELDGKTYRVVERVNAKDAPSKAVPCSPGQQILPAMEALIESYRRSRRWSQLSSRSQQDYEKILSYLGEILGAENIQSIQRPDVIREMNHNRHRIRFANYIQQVLSILFEHAIDIGWAEHNPARGVDKLKTPAEKVRGHVPWPDWAVARFRASARQFPLLVFELGIGSVQRPGDWPKFRWSDYDGDSLYIVQGKTGRALHLPCPDRLKAVLAGTARVGDTILANPDGSPCNYFKMARLMREERQRLGLLAYDLHALRYRGVMELAWANCSDDEIAAYSGHASTAMIRKYAGAARQEMRARTAAAKRDASFRFG